MTKFKKGDRAIVLHGPHANAVVEILEEVPGTSSASLVEEGDVVPPVHEAVEQTEYRVRRIDNGQEFVISSISLAPVPEASGPGD